VGLPDAVDLSLNQLCCSHLQHTLPDTGVGKDKRSNMKFATITRSLALGLGLLLAVSAFAATKGSLQISHPVTVNGTTLPAGDYKVEWEGSGSNVALSIMQGKSVVAKASAQMVELKTPASYDAAVIKKNEDGTSSLVGLRFGGKKVGFELGVSSDAMQVGSSK
jgi:hypothetical protein